MFIPASQTEFDQEKQQNKYNYIKTTTNQTKFKMLLPL